MNVDQMEARIVEVVFWRDETKVANWLDLILKASGGHATNEDGVITFVNGQGFGGGFHYNTDPITVAVMIASAVTAPHLWMKAFPGLLDKINRRWKEESKK